MNLEAYKNKYKDFDEKRKLVCPFCKSEDFNVIGYQNGHIDYMVPYRIEFICTKCGEKESHDLDVIGLNERCFIKVEDEESE